MFRFLPVLVVLFLSALSSFGQSEGNVPDSVELAFLKDFYTALQGDNWIDRTGWPDLQNWPDSATADEMGTWYGIVVLDNDISRIVIEANNLTGAIPESIGNLISLKELSLTNDLISGPLPSGLENCSNLDIIKLSNNIILDKIPDSWSQLTKVRIFHALSSGLNDSISTVLPGMTGLEDLNLSKNQLVGEIGDFSLLSNLRIINIGNH